MNADLWIHGRSCRIILKDWNGNYCDHNDYWNNRGSAESFVMGSYPECEIRFVTDAAEKVRLNAEWDLLPI